MNIRLLPLHRIYPGKASDRRGVPTCLMVSQARLFIQPVAGVATLVGVSSKLEPPGAIGLLPDNRSCVVRCRNGRAQMVIVVVSHHLSGAEGRSEERRVGKGCRGGGGRYAERK